MYLEFSTSPFFWKMRKLASPIILKCDSVFFFNGIPVLECDTCFLECDTCFLECDACFLECDSCFLKCFTGYLKCDKGFLLCDTYL